MIKFWKKLTLIYFFNSEKEAKNKGKGGSVDKEEDSNGDNLTKRRKLVNFLFKLNVKVNAHFYFKRWWLISQGVKWLQY